MATPNDTWAPIQPHQVPSVVETFALAFENDPVWSWLLDDDDARLDQLRALWQLLVVSAMRYPWMVATEGETAAALWIPPGGVELIPEEAKRLPSMMVGLVGDRAPLMMEFFDRFEEAHPRDREHYYLSLVGTHPLHRGAGIGVGLLAGNLRRFDAEGVPAYLESTNPANLLRYQALGFEPVGQVVLPHDGPVVTTMWREPRR